MQKKSNGKQSFSSFADLKDLQDSLRRQEAEDAKNKADAIIVDKEQEQHNPLKQKAARLAKFTQASLDQEKAKREQRMEAQGVSSSHSLSNTQQQRDSKNVSTKRSRTADRGTSFQRTKAGMDNHHRDSFNGSSGTDRSSSRPRHGQHDDTKRSDQRRSALGQQLIKAQLEQKKEEQALLQEKKQAAHLAQAHAHKGQIGESQEKKQKSQRKPQRQQQKQGRYLDADALKAVKAAASHVMYQGRRQLFGKLYELDTLITKLMQEKEIDLATALASEEVMTAKLALNDAIELEKAKLVEREEKVPTLTYPEALPVSQRREEIVKALREHQVVIIAGETGSGKTTQIPKMCLEAGLGRKGLIGHTQPRRLAARAVATRIADELQEPLGKSVSYKVRFTDISSPESYIKLMTDGILLSELATDRQLLSYDTIIIDEAHERSLNIDFLLGFLKGLLQKRPELKLIITSATIDVERFSEHFDNAPIIEVSGRTYPVEVVYMPLLEERRGYYIEKADGTGSYQHDHKSLAHEVVGQQEIGDDGPGQWRHYLPGKGSFGKDAFYGNYSPEPSRREAPEDKEDSTDPLELRQAILKAIRYLENRGRGDILVFLPGERDILETAQFLKKAGLRDTEIVPLYARLATQEQNRIFTEHSGVRIVLSTNVAETSLTVPGIRYVIDPGLARISRYSARTKVQRLPIEPISQASANQRKGRCGRVSDGICVRLYSHEDFQNRPEFTDPEILRTNLASVLLQMASLRLGSIENFPFIDAPQPRQISDGLRLLDELGATRPQKSNENATLVLTEVGRALSRLPCDPRLARMLVEADKIHALSEVLIIVSALAVMDPREYPLDKKEAATQAHKRFADEKSDFLSFIKLYNYLKDQQSKLSNSAFRKQLKSEYLSFLRVREWFDVHRQLRVSAQLLGMKFNEAEASYEEIHRSLLAGLLSHLGMIEPNGNNYLGARGSKFVIFPASGLAKKPPKWICACELTETSRLFARTVAAIDPLWTEGVGNHLLKNTYNEPHWSKKNGAVMAYLTRSIYGLPVVQKRVVQYKDVDPALCYELMIRDGFVGGNIETKFDFFKRNVEMIDDVEYLEDKVRRRDLLVDETTLEQFYAERVPHDINNIRDFEKWWRQQSKQNPDYLDFSYEMLSRQDLMSIEDNLYPEFWQQGSMRFKLSYLFDIGSDRDGVTVHIPITVLNQVKSEDFLWQIPGLRQELFAALIRSLPKRLRRNLIPAPEYAKALEEALRPYIDRVNTKDVGKQPGGIAAKTMATTNLFAVVAKELTRMGGELISVEDFDRHLIEPYLFFNFSIEGVDGKEMAFGKDFTALSSRLQNKAREVLHQVVKTHQTTAPSQSWEYGTIKRQQVTTQGSLKITAYPALTDHGEDGVSLELYDNPEQQERVMRKGIVRLLALSLKNPSAYLEAHLPNKAKLSMYYQPLGRVHDLISDIMLCAISNIIDRNGGMPWDETSFGRIKEIVRSELNDETLAIAKIAEQSLLRAHELKRLLKGRISFDVARSYADLNQQLDSLVYAGFISECGLEHLKELPRYLQAAIERVSRLNRDVVRDQMYMRTLEDLEEDYEKALKSYHKNSIPEPLKDVKWMLQELRVSYFAQHLGVNGPISDKRILSELQRIQKEWPPQR